MGQLLHGCARTTAAVRYAIQKSSDSIAALAERYHLNPKNRHKMEKAHISRRPADGANAPTVDCAHT